MSEQQTASQRKRRSHTIDVFMTKTNAKGEPVDRQVARVRPGEANVIVARGYGDWRGRKKQAITAFIPMNALLSFVGQMRFEPKSRPTALDSRTHKFLGGLRGYKHVRNSSYSPDAVDRVEMLTASAISALDFEELTSGAQES